jgi:hypothetical protein
VLWVNTTSNDYFGSIAPFQVPKDAIRREPGVDEDGTDGEPVGYYPTPGILWNGTPRGEDVAQGRLGDCSVMAALRAVADTNPQVIMAAFTSHEDLLSAYTVSLYPPGATAPSRFTVDIDLPVTKGQSTPAFAATQMAARPEGQLRILWPALLEKALAQMLGSYEALYGSVPSLTLSALSGRKTEQMTPIYHSDAALETILNEWLVDKSALTVCTLPSPPREVGLIGSHVYSLDALVEDSDGQTKASLKNPW